MIPEDLPFRPFMGFFYGLVRLIKGAIHKQSHQVGQVYVFP